MPQRPEAAQTGESPGAECGLKDVKPKFTITAVPTEIGDLLSRPVTPCRFYQMPRNPWPERIFAPLLR
jgi:hypothetical protein